MSFFNFITLLLLTITPFPLANSFNSSDSLDALLRDFALKTIVENRSHTGVLYKATPPGNLSGVKVSVLKIRSRGLWNKGASFGRFQIPPRTTSLPRVRRLAMVFQDLGNLSSLYYNVQGYKLAASVVGVIAFDASNSSSKRITNVTLITTTNPISIRFSNLNMSSKCITFLANGTSYVSEMGEPGLCHSREGGHFSIVVEEERGVVSVAVKVKVKVKQKFWHWWLRGFVVGFAGLVVVGLVGLVFVRLFRTKKIQIMERQADEDLVLSSRWVGRSKMPWAQGTRTLPSIEDGCFTRES